MRVPILRPASTVVLIRQAPAGIEVLLVRRHDDVAFMGGAHVFPGGRVEESDGDQRLLMAADGGDAAKARMADEAPQRATAFFVAAIRELFEEAGVLLARDAAGDMVSLEAVDTNDPVLQRDASSNGALSLLDLVDARRWRLALDTLVYFAHWVTPEIETRRFDTRFFLAAAPARQVAAHDACETTESIWLTPASAIARCLAGDLALPPPTWTTLRWLDPFERVTDALEWARRKPVPRIEPGVIEAPEGRIVLLPGDADMPAVAGFEAKETRFVLSDGRWTPVPRR